MNKIYILIHSNSVGSREQIKTWVNQCAYVTTWRCDLPHAFYLVSEFTAGDISKDFIGYFGKRGRHLIVEITENRQGLLPKETWHLFRNKELMK
jgi:hypothetical protein